MIASIVILHILILAAGAVAFGAGCYFGKGKKDD